MTFGTYRSKESKDKEDEEYARANSKYVEVCRELKRAEEEVKQSEKDLLKTFFGVGIAMSLIVALGGIASYQNPKEPQDKEIKSKNIEKVIYQEYQNEKSKLDSAYKIELKEIQDEKMKVDSIYSFKADSLKKVYESKLEKGVK